jgi:hypothetical protein
MTQKKIKTVTETITRDNTRSTSGNLDDIGISHQSFLALGSVKIVLFSILSRN